MSPIAVLASELTIQEAHVATGRLSSSLVNDIAKAGGTSAHFEKDGAVTAAALPDRWYNRTNVPLEVTKVQLAVGTAPTGAALVVDAKINGTSVFTAAGTRASIAIAGFTGEAVPDKTGEAIIVRPGQYVTTEVTQVGSTVAGSDLLVDVRFG